MRTRTGTPAVAREARPEPSAAIARSRRCSPKQLARRRRGNRSARFSAHADADQRSTVPPFSVGKP
jgi:hypothetical protein